MDDGLNFPLKVNAVAGVARRRGIDLHVSACGVGARWSGMAHTLFSRTLSEARTITVRDASSLERLNRFLPGLPSPPRLTFDPAIWAAEVYGQPEGPAGDRPPFGLGLLGLHEVNSYAPPGGAFTAESLVQFWLDVLAGLRREGVAFELFTNGTDSDYLFARQVCREAQARLAFEPDLNDRPFWPRELAHQVSRYQAVLSSRLHGGIIALSYGIPAAGLAWDDKVKSFYAATGRSEFCVSIYDRNPDALVKALQLAAREGVDPGAVVRWKERALENAAVVLGSGAL
jgi:polysaccharide pyruvyl transferase WcaK-like protein